MKRRIFCAVMTVVLVLTMLPVVAAAGEEPTITFGHAVYEEEGLVDVIVYLNNNPGFVTATIPVTWDNSVLNLYNVSIDDTIATSGWCGMDIGEGEGEYQSNGTYYLAWDNDITIESADDQFTADGELAMLQFSIVDADAVETAVSTMNANIANLMSFDMEDNWGDSLCSELNVVLTNGEGGDDPVVDPDAPSAYISMNNETEFIVGAGETFDVEVVLKNCDAAKGVILYDLAYDSDLIAVDSQEWLLTGGLISDLGDEPIYVSASYVDVNTAVFKITCTAADISEEKAETELSYTVQVNTAAGNVVLTTVPANITIRSYVPGDVDSDEDVDIDDAIYLVRYTFLPDRYPVGPGDHDYDSDGDVDIDDAIYLVRHTFLPDRYPIG